MASDEGKGPAQWNLLTGEAEEVFASALERYGVWPTTVWEVDYSDPLTRELKQVIGDLGREQGDTTTRDGSFMGTGGGGCYDIGASIFSPAVASWILNLYSPEPPAQVFDPFAGGGTRAILSAKKGHEYRGCELRSVEVEAVHERCRQAGVRVASDPDQKQAAGEGGSVELFCCDARRALEHVEPASADFLLTCPPYFDLETYDGGPRDLSMASSYRAFLEGLSEVVAVTHKVLRPGSFSCWVIGLHRDKRSGELLTMHHAVALLHRAHGFHHKEEVILAAKNNGAIQRIGNFDKGDRRLVRLHEYLQVFVRT